MELGPAIAAALGVPGMTDRLGLPPASRACFLFVDGLGYEALSARRADAPFLWEHASRRDPLTSPFPSTTATSTATFGTAATPGEHGIVGYTMAVAGFGVVNAITWRLAGSDERDLRGELVPESFQPLATVYERMAEIGIAPIAIAPLPVRGSGLTRAALRPAEVRPIIGIADLVGETRRAIEQGARFVHAYTGELDSIGHMRGVGSHAWRLELETIDRAAREIADALEGGLLVVSADHGMVDVPHEGKLPALDDPELRRGVRAVAGEARARHVYAESGEAEAVLARWRDRLADRALVLSRDEAIGRGWFGTVREDVRGRIGDVVAVSLGGYGLFSPEREPREAGFVGHHGSLTPGDCLVPLVVVEA